VLRSVIQAMYEMGVNPVFWVDQAQQGKATNCPANQAGLFHVLAGRIRGMRFIIRDLLWLIVVVALSLGWRMQLRDLLEINASLNAERDAYRTAYERHSSERDRMEAEDLCDRNELRLIVDSIHSLGIDLSHLVSTARIAKNDGNGRGVRVVVEPLPPRSFNSPSGMDASF
jgi:hypothetical protein